MKCQNPSCTKEAIEGLKFCCRYNCGVDYNNGICIKAGCEEQSFDKYLCKTHTGKPEIYYGFNMPILSGTDEIRKSFEIYLGLENTPKLIPEIKYSDQLKDIEERLRTTVRNMLLCEIPDATIGEEANGFLIEINHDMFWVVISNYIGYMPDLKNTDQEYKRKMLLLFYLLTRAAEAEKVSPLHTNIK